jgi:hypothetical protein
MESIAPTTPGSPSASALSSTSIRISWTASTDSGGSGLAGYKVYRSAIYLISGSNPITATSFDDTGLASSNNYSYTVKAFDGVGNVSAATSAVNATTSADTIAPTTPGSFSMNWTDPWAAFTWTASTDSGGSGFAGYKIYFVGNDGAEFEMLISGSNPLTDTSWGIDTTGWEWEYFVGFRIYAVDGENNLSTPANWTPQ